MEVISLVNILLIFIEKFGGYIESKNLYKRWSLVVREFGISNFEANNTQIKIIKLMLKLKG
jgi:hypothetical protein